MKLFAIHILIKDLSSLIAYLVILKFNLTNETYLPEMVGYFPGAPNMTWEGIMIGTLTLSKLPLLVSVLTYYPIYLGVKKLFGQTTIITLLATATILTLTTPVVYLIIGGKIPLKYDAEIISWTLCIVLSLTTYLLFNRSELQQQKVA
jgi:hypothetical protein